MRMNRTEIQEAMKHVPHCAVEEHSYPEGSYLMVYTMLGDDPAGCDYGPVIGIGPFTDAGDHAGAGLSVWVEVTENISAPTSVHLARSTESVLAAVLMFHKIADDKFREVWYCAAHDVEHQGPVRSPDGCVRGEA